KEQVVPIPGGDLKLLLKYVNIIDPEHRLLFLTFIVSCFMSGFPHAALVIFGAQGSAKSTLSKLTRLTVDPSIVDAAGMPTDAKEFIQMLSHHHLTFFDNVSKISDEISDTFCKIISG